MAKTIRRGGMWSMKSDRELIVLSKTKSLDDLRDANVRQKLKWVFSDPEPGSRIEDLDSLIHLATVRAADAFPARTDSMFGTRASLTAGPVPKRNHQTFSVAVHRRRNPSRDSLRSPAQGIVVEVRIARGG
jgi:hypothetical protein